MLYKVKTSKVRIGRRDEVAARGGLVAMMVVNMVLVYFRESAC